MYIELMMNCQRWNKIGVQHLIRNKKIVTTTSRQLRDQKLSSTSSAACFFSSYERSIFNSKNIPKSKKVTHLPCLNGFDWNEVMIKSSSSFQPYSKTALFSSSSSELKTDGSKGSNHNSSYFKKVLIANRGEIAVRVIRTCRRLGISTVAIHSTADSKSLHVALADEAICVGPPSSLQSYLNIDAILDAVKQTGAEAVHPGYGFLSENAEFSQKVKEMGVAFVGPSEYAITSMGDKITSKKIAMEAGVNTIPGFEGIIKDEEEAIQIANKVGYPIMIKATAGGGGKGMRIAYNDEETKDAFRLCSSEARNFFKDDRLFIEKYIENPHHIEIQVLAGKNKTNNQIETICFPERECSIQRRNQKIIEESPSVLLLPETRAEMVRQCKALVQKVGYESAGTVEWLVDENQNFYFLEMNTRLQVEHPVTEMVTGVDLVEGMLRVAKGEGIDESLLQNVKDSVLNTENNNLDITDQELAKQIEGAVVPYKGWAMEARIYAEDPVRGFLPSVGPLLSYQEPNGPSIRVDSGVKEGHVISSHYDPMISKLVVHSSTRGQTIEKMISALDRYVIKGVGNNKSFLSDVCRHTAFMKGDTPTNFIQKHYPNGFQGVTLTQIEKHEFAAMMTTLAEYRRNILRQPPLPLSNVIKEKKDQDDWLAFASEINEEATTLRESDPNHDFSKKMIVAIGGMFGEKYEVISHEEGKFLVKALDDDGNGTSMEIILNKLNYDPKHPIAELLVNGKTKTVQIFGEETTGELNVQFHGSPISILLMSEAEYQLTKFMNEPVAIDTSDKLLSPMPGTLISYNVKEGDEVVIGQELCIVEAMKMQNILRSNRVGSIKKLHGKVGSSLRSDEIIMEFE